MMLASAVQVQREEFIESVGLSVNEVFDLTLWLELVGRHRKDVLIYEAGFFFFVCFCPPE